MRFSIQLVIFLIFSIQTFAQSEIESCPRNVFQNRVCPGDVVIVGNKAAPSPIGKVTQITNRNGVPYAKIWVGYLYTGQDWFPVTDLAKEITSDPKGLKKGDLVLYDNSFDCTVRNLFENSYAQLHCGILYTGDTIVETKFVQPSIK
jgi:hypothetical protein